MRTSKVIFSGILLVALLGCGEKNKSAVPHFKTHWTVKVFFKYELCNFIGILTGRELYSKYYGDLQAEWRGKMPPSVVQALKQIDTIIGPQQPPGPRLCVLFGATIVEDSLKTILAALNDDQSARHRLMASDFASEKNWQQWQLLKPYLRTVLEFLQKEEFELYWSKNLYPKLAARLPRLQQELQSYDVAGDIDRFLLEDEASDTLMVIASWLLQPHAIRLTPECYLTDVNYPMHVTVKSAYHELLHPVGERLVDSVFVKQFEALRADPFLQQALASADLALGYRNFMVYCREEVVLAADLLVSERRRVISQLLGANGGNAPNAVRTYLERHEGGVHVLAAVIYSYLEAGLKLDRMSYSVFLKELFGSGRLQAGKIEARYRDFMQNKNLAGR